MNQILAEITLLRLDHRFQHGGVVASSVHLSGYNTETIIQRTYRFTKQLVIPASAGENVSFLHTARRIFSHTQSLEEVFGGSC
jgi:hypothetical protein